MRDYNPELNKKMNAEIRKIERDNEEEKKTKRRRRHSFIKVQPRCVRCFQHFDGISVKSLLCPRCRRQKKSGDESSIPLNKFVK
jgi:hypothetical protein